MQKIKNEETKEKRKREKIDIIMLKYAFAGRRYMMDMVNRGIRSEYFGEGADKIYRILFELFTDSAVASVVSQDVFIEHCIQNGKNETADLAKELFSKMEKVTANEEDYSYRLKEFRTKYNKEVIKENADLINAGVDANLDTEVLNELIRKAHTAITSLNRIEVFDEGTVGEDIDNMIAEYAAVEANKTEFLGVMTGFRELDAITNGFQPGELILVAGMEGTGKSLVMMNMGINAWLGSNKDLDINEEVVQDGRNILYFTLEMPRSNQGRAGTSGYLNKRIMSAVAGVPFSALRKAELSADEKNKFLKAAKFVKNYEKHYVFHVVDIPRGATIEDIEIKYQEVRQKYAIDLVIIDYMGIMAASKGLEAMADWEVQGHIAAGLHEFARVNKVPVLTGVQLNRPEKSKGLKEQAYNNTRLGRSALIGQNANTVLMIGCRDNEESYSDMPLHLTKMRDGQKGKINLTKDFPKMRVFSGALPDGTGLDQFEDLKAKNELTNNPEPIPTLYDDQVSMSKTGLGDWGEPSDMSDADF